MDIAELRVKLDNIAAALAEQDVQQEDIAIEEETIEEAHMMPKTLKCKECGDMLGNPTTDCPCDSMDPKGDNWIMVDVDNDGDMDMAVANEEDHHEKDEDGNVIPHDEIEEEAVEEATVEVPVQELADLMQLAGYANYADKIEEYANEPEEEYQDAEDQLIGLSGGLNGPKNMHTPAAGGDNPMDKEALKTVEENLYKSYQAFLEEAEIKEDSTSMVGYAPKGTKIDPKTGKPIFPKSDGPKVKAEPAPAPAGTKLDPKTGKITAPKGSGPFVKNL